MTTEATADIVCISGGPDATIIIFSPRTQAGHNWCAEHIGEPWAQGHYATEIRYAVDIVRGMIMDGLLVYDTWNGPAKTREELQASEQQEVTP